MKSFKLLLVLFLLLTGLVYYNSCDETVTNQIITELVTHGWAVGIPNNGYGYILSTTDAGNTWTRQGDSSMLANIELLDLAVLDKQTVWVVGSQGTVILTTDGGINWQKQTTPPGEIISNLESISVLDRSNAWISGAESVILHTMNGGSTWDRVTITGAPSNVQLQGICAADVNNIWAVGQNTLGSEGYIYNSTDAGTSWNRIIPSVMPPDSAAWIGVEAISVNDVWIHGGDGKLIHTTDNGQTWTHVPTPFEAPGTVGGPDLNDMSFINANTGYFACDNDNILYTNNSGVSWDTSTAPPPYPQFLVGVHTISQTTSWIVGHSTGYPPGGKIIFTTNGGTTWNLKMQTSTSLWKIAFVK